MAGTKRQLGARIDSVAFGSKRTCTVVLLRPDWVPYAHYRSWRAANCAVGWTVGLRLQAHPFCLKLAPLRRGFFLSGVLAYLNDKVGQSSIKAAAVVEFECVARLRDHGATYLY